MKSKIKTTLFQQIYFNILWLNDFIDLFNEHVITKLNIKKQNKSMERQTSQALQFFIWFVITKRFKRLISENSIIRNVLFI